MVFDRLKEVICDEMEIPYEDFTLDANLREDFDLDSLDMVDIIMDIEDEFGVEITEDALEKLTTVKDVVEYIEANQ